MLIATFEGKLRVGGNSVSVFICSRDKEQEQGRSISRKERSGKPSSDLTPGSSVNTGEPPEVADVGGCDDDLLTRIADHHRQGRQDRITVEGVGRGGRDSDPANDCPKLGGFSPGFGRDRRLAEGGSRRVKARELGRSVQADHLAPDLEIDYVRDGERDPLPSEPAHPGDAFALLVARL